jgi:hypothetical protein
MKKTASLSLFQCVFFLRRPRGLWREDDTFKRSHDSRYRKPYASIVLCILSFFKKIFFRIRFSIIKTERCVLASRG